MCARSPSDIDKLYLRKLLTNLNTSVDPCNNFYDYACGNWSMNYISQDYVDMPGYMDRKVNKQLRQILWENQNRTGIYRKAWHQYQACERLPSLALNEYLRIVQQELNFQWPIFREDWNQTWQNESDFDWIHTIAHLRKYGLNGIFITEDLNVRLSNGSHFLIEINQHQDIHPLERKKVLQIFLDFGMTLGECENLTESIVLLETRMKRLEMTKFVFDSEDDDRKYLKTFKEMTISELMAQVPNIDWRRYFGTILGRDVNAEQEIVQTFALKLDYFDELQSVLDSSSNETICYYIMLKFMYKLNEMVPNGKDNSISCIKHLRGYMSLAMNYMYEEHIYSGKREVNDAVIRDMYNKLRINFAGLVDQNHLGLNETERLYILEELNSMQIKIGNIPEGLTREFVETHYKNVAINSSNFYLNHLQLLKLMDQTHQGKLLNIAKPIERRFYELDPETDSSSSPVKLFDNAILVPYGYIQLPFFTHDLSTQLQYSLFGFILAHEIVHAFDMFHVFYDHRGNYNEMGLAVFHHFWEHIDCFTQHATENLSENIADVSGLRLVYQTYFEDVINKNPQSAGEQSENFNWTNLTSEQLFFINSIQFLCANMAKISEMDINSLDLGHDINDIRVRNNWANFDPFAAAFNCSNGTAMNPERKCRLW